MRRTKILLLLLLTAAVVVCGAVFPGAASAVMDLAENEKAGSAPMQSVELEFGKSKTEDIMWKLSAWNHANLLSIVSANASMTEAEAYDAAQQAISPYTMEDMIKDFTETSHTLTPYLAVDPDNSEPFFIVWEVTLSGKNDRFISMYLDDETGMPLYIHYQRYGTFSMDGIWEQNRAIGDRVTSLFFDALGISTTGGSVTVREYERDGGVLCMSYTFADTGYGNVNIDFYIEGTGSFYNYYPG